MRKLLLLSLILVLYSGHSFAKKNQVIDTIAIAQINYEKKIVFNHEMLYDFSGDLNNKVASYIDANKFLVFVKTKANPKFYRRVFSDAEVDDLIKRLSNYIETQLQESDELVIERPSYHTAMELRNAYEDMNFAIFHLLRNGYFISNMKNGNVNFYYKKDNEFANTIIVSEKNRKAEKRKSVLYNLDIDGHEIFSEDKEL